MYIYMISLKSCSSALALLTSMGRPEEDGYRNILFARLGFEHCGFLDILCADCCYQIHVKTVGFERKVFICGLRGEKT